MKPLSNSHLDRTNLNISCPCCQAPSQSKVLIRKLPRGAQYFTKTPNQLSPSDAYLHSCLNCSHVFLDVIPVSYYRTVIRSIGVSADMASFRTGQFKQIKEKYYANSDSTSCLEVGAGAGEYALLLSKVFNTVISTEYSTNGHGSHGFSDNIIQTHPEEEDFVDKLSTYAPFDIVCCFSYLEHLPSPSSFFSKVRQLISDNGIIIVEVPNTSHILGKSLVNEIIPDHIQYFTPLSVQTLAHKYGLSLDSMEIVWNGYIMSCIFRVAPGTDAIQRLSVAQQDLQSDVLNLLDSYQEDSVVALWGAGHQALFALSYTALAHRVSFLVDSSPLKQNMYTPGSNLYIYSPEYLLQSTPSLIIVACAGYNNEVIEAILRMKLGSDIAILDEKGISLIEA